jgi:hypothetical protein
MFDGTQQLSCLGGVGVGQATAAAEGGRRVKITLLLVRDSAVWRGRITTNQHALFSLCCLGQSMQAHERATQRFLSLAQSLQTVWGGAAGSQVHP